MRRTIFYLFVTWYNEDDPINELQFWDLVSAYEKAREYEKKKGWRKIEIYESTPRKLKGEIQPNTLYYIKRN